MKALAIARNALPMFGIGPGAAIDFVKQRENVVFRVTDGDASYAVRIHRLGHRTDDEVRTEGAFMAALHQSGVPVSDVVRTVSGGLFAEVSGSDGEAYQIDAQHWVDNSSPLGDAGDAWMGTDALTVGVFSRLGEMCPVP